MQSFKWRIGILVLGILWCIAVYFGNPNNPNSLLPACPTYKFLGIYCAGCGSTRALYALLHLDFATAIRQNVFFVCLIPFIVMGIFYPKTTSVKYVPLTILIAMIVYIILRNMDYFYFLAPIKS